MHKTAMIVALLLASTGCSRLTWSKEVTGMLGNDVEAWVFDPPTYAQAVTVTVKPTAGGVSAFVVKGADEKQAAAALARGLPPESLLLGSKVAGEAAEEYSFEVKIPARTGYVLFIKSVGKKQNDVKVTVVGK